jgi:hypothetical protein
MFSQALEKAGVPAAGGFFQKVMKRMPNDFMEVPEKSGLEMRKVPRPVFYGTRGQQHSIRTVLKA